RITRAGPGFWPQITGRNCDSRLPSIRRLTTQGQGGRRMPQVRICSISEYSVTDCHHLQPTGAINQWSSSCLSILSSSSSPAKLASFWCIFVKLYRNRRKEPIIPLGPLKTEGAWHAGSSDLERVPENQPREHSCTRVSGDRRRC